MDLYHDWMDQLAVNIDVPYVQAAPPPPSYIKKPIHRQLGVYASVYFKVFDKDSNADAVLGNVLRLHHQFDDMTGNQLLHYRNSDGNTYKQLSHQEIARRASQELNEIESFRAAFLTHYSTVKSLQSSPQFLFTAAVISTDLERSFYSYINIQVPYSWWRSHRIEFEQWWNTVLTQLPADQAYLGLGYSKAARPDQWRFHEHIDYLMAQRFYGYDVDKPFWMSSPKEDGPYLQHGLRTPTYGILVQGDWLDRVGGKSVIQSQLTGRLGYRVTAVGQHGYWIEAGEEPALYPVEQGVPPVLQHLYYTLKPVILDQLWMTGYQPNFAEEEGVFQPDSTQAWLKRFDRDSNWPTQAIRDELRAKQAASTPTEVRHDIDPVWGGNPATATGHWVCPNMAQGNPNRKGFFREGDILPEGLSSKGGYVWHYVGE